MANEINVSATLTAAKNGVTLSQTGSVAITQSGNVALSEVRSVATTAAAMSFGTITGAPVAVLLWNKDSTNYINYGPSNPPTEFKLPAGHVAIFQPSSATQYWKANSAACLVLIEAVEA